MSRKEVSSVQVYEELTADVLVIENVVDFMIYLIYNQFFTLLYFIYDFLVTVSLQGTSSTGTNLVGYESKLLLFFDILSIWD